MDFDLTDEQSAVAELAAQVIGDLSTPERLRQMERRGTEQRELDAGFDRDLWSALAAAGLTGVAVPEAHGGAGCGLLEACGVLREVGRHTAAIPAVATIATAALALARFGDEEQQRRWLPGIADGTVVVAPAIVEPLGDPRMPSLRAERAGEGWVLDGERTNVAFAGVSDLLIIPAVTDHGVIVALVVSDHPGVERAAQRTTSGAAEASVRLSQVVVTERDLLGGVGGGAAVQTYLVDVATVAACAVMAGVTAQAVKITGEYATQRQQFGRPLAAFQAVTQRAADAYVDAQSVELTMLQAAWRLDAELFADREIAVAKFFAAEAGQRALAAAQHLHGGIGVDRDYPLHRYYLMGKELELFLGGASRQLLRLGLLLADDEGVAVR